LELNSSSPSRPGPLLFKSPTGIKGLDEVTLGGLPKGRTSLFCGGPGSGKTMFAITFLVNGVTIYDEPGVFLTFEERPEDLIANVASLGFDLESLVRDNKILIDHIRVEKSEIEESGEYDLEGLFVRLNYAIDKIGAKRVVLDTLEALFAGLTKHATLRSELRRLFAWLKEKGVTAIVTGERGEGGLTRYGIEEYVSDCVISLDNRVLDQVSTRRLRIVKYRGSAHGANEYPFLIDDEGISVLPITSAGLEHKISGEAVSSGVPGLDAMLGKGGFYQGSSVLLSGLAGTGKSTFAASFARSVCANGGRCLYFAFEESPDQLIRNMASAGIDLAEQVENGRLLIKAARPTLYGFEMHLARMHRDIDSFQPAAAVVDPISAFRGPAQEIHSTLLRLADICKSQGVTALFTSLSLASDHSGEWDRGVSSLMDTWISLTDLESDGERNRVLYVLKSRGMHHSNQMREYRLTDHGPVLIEPYVGPSGVLTGSARLAQEAREAEDLEAGRGAAEKRRRELDRRRQIIERQIADLKSSLGDDEEEFANLDAEAAAREQVRRAGLRALADSRGVRDEH